MKKFLTLALLTLLTYSVYAAGHLPMTKITNVVIKEKDNTVTITFDAVVTKLNSDYKLTLTPILYHGSHSQLLRSIVVMGSNKSIVEKRSGNPVGGQLNGKIGQTIPYRITVAYESWMNEVSLKLNSMVDGCCEQTRPLASLILVNNKLIYYDIEPTLDIKIIEPQLQELHQLDKISTFLYPVSGYGQRYEIFEKQRNDKEALVIHFRQGSSLIDPYSRNNKQALAQISRVFELIDADASVALKKVVIVGLASPEGSLARNDILAEARANSLKNFIGERVKYDPSLFELVNASEDWEGLKALVENSRMPGRWEVLDIIDKYSVLGGREGQLMRLDGGNPYRYMMKHFFPRLRNAGYVQIYYELTPDLEAEKIKSAIKLVDNKQYDKALPLLLSVNGDKQLENMIGVCYMMIGDYARATTYFEKAIAAGHKYASDAVKNLEQIRIVQSIK